MFDWLKFIGEFFLERISSIFDLFSFFVDAVATIGSAFMAAPSFLYPIISLMLSIAIIMWVVNIL